MSHSEIPRDRSINYVEFVVSSIQQAKIFYGSVFGWTFTDYGENYCEFSDGEMKGGFETGTPKPEGGALIVLYGHDLEALMQSIRDAGGQITRPVFEFPGGRRFHFTDLEGYELAVWQHS